MAAWQGFLRSHVVLLDTLDAELVERHALPLAWYDVLVQLHESGGSSAMGALAERLLISPSTCTRVVERMASAGFVERRVGEPDARVRVAELTPAGRRMLRAASVTHLAGIRRYFAAHIDETEAQLLAAIFDRIGRSLR